MKIFKLCIHIVRIICYITYWNQGRHNPGSEPPFVPHRAVYLLLSAVGFFYEVTFCFHFCRAFRCRLLRFRFFRSMHCAFVSVEGRAKSYLVAGDSIQSILYSCFVTSYCCVFSLYFCPFLFVLLKCSMCCISACRSVFLLYCGGCLERHRKSLFKGRIPVLID